MTSRLHIEIPEEQMEGETTNLIQSNAWKNVMTS